MLVSKRNLPSWAHRSAQRAEVAQSLAEQGKPQVDDQVHTAVPNAERATQEIGEMRQAFVTYRGYDEDPRFDTALGQVGTVKLPGEDGEVNLSGTSLSGSLDIRTPKAIVKYAFDKTAVSYQELRADGNFEAGHLRLDAPHASFQLSSNSFDASNPSVPKSEGFEATVSAGEILSSLPQGRPESLFREVFFDGTKSMTSVRESFLNEFKSSLGGLGLSSDDFERLNALVQNPYSGTPRMLAQELSKLRAAEPESKELSALAEKAGLWQAVEDFPKLKADGIMRASEYYISPGHLQAQAAALGWDFDDESGLPIADTVIVGGGPGGLSSAYHLSERGTRTVLFEGGHVGQGFSDAGAQSVHQLRTNGAASNLIYTANANTFGVDVSMQRHLGETRKKCSEARKEWSEGTREPQHGISEARGNEVDYSANRGELFEHMSHLAHGLALHYPDTLVSENSPVSQIQKVERGEGQPDLFKITTERGHEVLARSLVMATGFVGGDGQHARSLKIFQNLEDTPNSGVTVLPNDHDLFRDNDTIDSELLVFSERLIGRPEVRQRIKALPEGSRVSVVGGGESATKGALEALYLNPNISLDLYTSAPIEPYQTQIPTSVLSHAITESAIRNKDVADRTLQTLRGFGTPVTPETLEELLQFEANGRVRIHELGKRFDERTMVVTPHNSDGVTSLHLQIKDPEVADNLRSQRKEWIASGLYGQNPPQEDPTALPQADMVIVAAGYDKRSMQAGPLIQQLQDQDLVEFQNGSLVYGSDGLTSSKNEMISFNTAGAVAMASDTALPGRAIRAYRLAQNFDSKLPAREKPTDRVPSGLAYGNLDTNSESENFNWPKEEVLRFIDSGGRFPEDIKRRQETVDKLTDPAEKASAQLRLDASIRFPGPNSPLAALMVRANEVPESLSPAERLMWERAQSVSLPA